MISYRPSILLFTRIPELLATGDGVYGRWHHVRVALTDEGHVVSATLDDVTERMSGAGRGDQQSQQLRLPPSVYYGGMDVSANTFGSLALRYLFTYLKTKNPSQVTWAALISVSCNPPPDIYQPTLRLH